MKNRFTIFHPIFVFIVAQLAWLSLLGLWIYWYVTNYIIFKQVGENYAPQLLSKGTNVMALVSGLILLVFVLGGMYFIFIYLARQINITKLYDNFIANVTHELKSPLASIQLYLETLNERQVPEKRRKEFFSLMIKDVNRLQNLINSILKLSGLEKKKMATHYQVYQVDEVMKDLIEQAKDKFNLSSEVIKLEGKASCQCVIDRSALRMVVDNLIDNAIKFSQETLQLTVQMSCSDKKFALKIRDEGIGIEEKEQKKIFHKFYQIYGRHIPNVRGTGLGLHMAQEIIKAHGGEIMVFSGGENKGSTFIIELPVYQSSKKRYLRQLLKMTNKQEQQKNAA